MSFGNRRRNRIEEELRRRPVGSSYILLYLYIIYDEFIIPNKLSSPNRARYDEISRSEASKTIANDSPKSTAFDPPRSV